MSALRSRARPRGALSHRAGARGRAAGVAAALVLALAGVGATVVRPVATLPDGWGGRPVAQAGTAVPAPAGWDRGWLVWPQSALGGVQRLADARAAALLAGDGDALRATVDATGPAAGRQAMLAGNLSRLRPVEWRYAVEALAPVPDGRYAAAGDLLTATIVLRYRLRAWAEGMVTRRATWTVRAEPGRWVLVDDGLGGSAPRSDADLWDLTPVTVTDGARSVVITARDRPAAGGGWSGGTLAAQADAAVRRVTAVWPGPWSRHVVLVGPADLGQLTRLVPAPPGPTLGGAWAQVAAVTTGPPASAWREADTDQIVLNPTTWGRLLPVGQQVVLTHEATHVATRAVITRPLPDWLTEGFADYVAFRGTGLPASVVAADALASAAAAGVPQRLPTDAELSGRAGPPDVAYQRSWLAVRAVADRWGQARMVDWFRAAADGSPQAAGDPTRAVDRASRRILGADLGTLVQVWRAELRQLALAAMQTPTGTGP